MPVLTQLVRECKMSKELVDTGLTRDHVERETAKAVLFSAPQGRKVWLPKSKIEWIATHGVYAESAHIPAWLARQSF
jgi:hypothetical protein